MVNSHVDISPVTAQTILDCLPEALIVLNAEQVIIKCNHTAQRLCAWVNLSVGDLLTKEKFFQLLQNPKHKPSGLFISKNSSDFVANTSHPVRVNSLQFAYEVQIQSIAHNKLLIIRDVTDLRKAERQRADASHMLVHDLRSPLTAVIGGLRLVRDILQTSDEMALKAIQVAERSAQRILTLIESLLDIAKFEAQGFDIEPTAEELLPLIRRVVENIQPLAVEAQVQIRLQSPKQVPLVLIEIEQIERVLFNLLDNAIKFSDAQSTIDIVVEYLPQQESVRVNVRDSGPGVPTAEIGSIFERFQQGSSRSKSRRKGVGLGLAFCKMAIEAHDGQIWYAPGLHGGSQFLFTLPAVNLPERESE